MFKSKSIIWLSLLDKVRYTEKHPNEEQLLGELFSRGGGIAKAAKQKKDESDLSKKIHDAIKNKNETVAKPIFLFRLSLNRFTGTNSTFAEKKLFSNASAHDKSAELITSEEVTNKNILSSLLSALQNTTAVLTAERRLLQAIGCVLFYCYVNRYTSSGAALVYHCKSGLDRTGLMFSVVSTVVNTVVKMTDDNFNKLITEITETTVALDNDSMSTFILEHFRTELQKNALKYLKFSHGVTFYSCFLRHAT